ncbi:MAG: OmpA family protein [Woeseia sp.]|nr:OmpA family protein [Woeseia sp.]MBT8095734.1 OmpA family protein [Woeseia sp.]NNE62429.1 OmpA family protein [Woeseia sp.]NNL55370.1 OmpA family protein [Woeseia sp.]
MKFFLRTALVSAVFASSFAFADAQPGQTYISPMGTYIDDDVDRGVDDEFAGGQLGFGFVLSDLWNLEAFVQGASLSGTVGQDQFGAGVDLQRIINRDGRFSPYWFVGAGILEIDRDNARSEDGGMYSLGAGFLADIFGDSGVALRSEFRYRTDNIIDRRSRDKLVSVGLQFPFGEKSAEYADSDGDGVSDALDRCPGTPMGVVVDATGCEPDGDKDGVADSRDKCPMTRAGATVDSNGCERDSDGDGVKDGLDLCPNTPAGARVNAQGCEMDSDGDKVVDRLDKCPNTRAGAQVDVSGCEIKEEIKLPGVNFESNSARLLPGAERVLNDAAETLRRNPSITVEVAGHTDSDGAADYNESLSDRRARAVRDYLAGRGVSMNRMTARGYGEADPIASNANAQGKAMNRRVVLRVTAR